jgi:hypothetical protein
MSLAQARVPAIVVSSLICLAVGVGIGMFAMSFFGYNWNAALPVGPQPPSGQAGPPGGPMTGKSPAPPGGSPGMAGMMSPEGKGGPPGAGGKGGMGGRGPSPKIQLMMLVNKLEALTGKPLALQLNDEQKKKVQEQLQGLEGKDDLADEDAKKRLDALLEVVKDQKGTLEAAGYRWPGEGFGPRPSDAPNPFKEETNANRLKAIQERLGKK